MPVLHKHWAIFFTAFALLLAQFIAELIGVYVIFDVVPSIVVYFYRFFIYLIVVHIFFSLALVLWGKSLARHFYKET